MLRTVAVPGVPHGKKKEREREFSEQSAETIAAVIPLSREKGAEG